MICSVNLFFNQWFAVDLAGHMEGHPNGILNQVRIFHKAKQGFVGLASISSRPVGRTNISIEIPQC